MIAAVAAAAALAATGAHAAPAQPRLVRLVDRTRVAHLRTGATVPRVLVTEVRVPAHGRPPFPLVVFAHGFALEPADYTRLLDTWTRAGYVVAAPRFPVEYAHAPGGPDRTDLPNEPGDLRFAIARLTAHDGPLHGLADPRRVAVAGQSDGGVAALSAAADVRYADPHVRAAIVMSGAPLGGFALARRTPPLLAVQGTADPLNAPGTTAGYFGLLHRPKFLLWLDGAPHEEPYTARNRWSAVVARATTAFLDRYLRGRPLRRLLAAGRVPGVASLQAAP